jgi:hypothetical protein
MTKLEALVDEAIVDAYGEDEQRVGFFTMMEDHLKLRFETVILGAPVTVETVEFEDDDILAVCVRRKGRQAVPILKLPLPAPPPKGSEWIAAYRHWTRGG